MSSSRQRAPAPQRARLGAAVLLAWVVVVGIASIAALIEGTTDAVVHPLFAFWFVLFGVPFTALAVHLIRNRFLVWAATIVAAVLNAWACWTTLRDTRSTAAVGVLWSPYFCVPIFLVALVLDTVVRFVSRNTERRRSYRAPS